MACVLLTLIRAYPRLTIFILSKLFGHLCRTMLRERFFVAIIVVRNLTEMAIIIVRSISQGSNVRHTHCFQDEDSMQWLKRPMAKRKCGVQSYFSYHGSTIWIDYRTIYIYISQGVL